MAAFNISDASTWPSLAKPDPEFEELVKALPGGAPDIGAFSDIPSLRQFVTDVRAQAGRPPKPEGVNEEDRKIPMRDGHEIAVRIHSPVKAPSTGSPLGVSFHGGGWDIGGLDDEATLNRRLVSELGMVVVNVDYRLGPEWKFPTAHNDCYDATKWAAKNSKSLGADPSKGFIVGGTSAGGNLAAFVSHAARDDKMEPKITGCHLMIPALCNVVAVPEKYRKDYQSWDQLQNAYILSHKAVDLFLDNFISVEDRADEKFSVLNWKTGHKDLPPQSFQICGADPLRDEALIYERVVREEYGVETKVEVYPGLPHGFSGLFPQMQAAQQFVDDSVAGVKWLLKRT